MTWSIQLTTWALPPLLGVLVTLREAGYLWPRRHERGVDPLLGLLGVSGTWAAIHLFTVVLPDPDTKVGLTGAAYAIGAVAPVAWVWFALSLAGRGDALRRWPAIVLYGASLVTVVLAVLLTRHGLLIDATAVVDRGGVVGLRAERGTWDLVHTGLRIIAVVAGTAILLRSLLHRSDAGPRIVLIPVAAAVALGPTFARFATDTTATWTDLTPAGFAVGSALLGWSVLRHRLLHLGPVARTLVMVEMRDPIVVLDAKGRIVDVNRAADRILGLRPYGDVPVALGTLWAASWRDPDATSRITLEVREDPAEPERPGPGGPTAEGDLSAAVRSDREGGPTGEADRAGEHAADPDLTAEPGLAAEPDLATPPATPEDPAGPGDDDDGRGGTPNGAPKRTFEVTITPLGDRGVPGHTALLFRDITARDRIERHLLGTTEALTEANRELKRLAHTDALTDLANRRHFMDRLAREVDRSHRYGRPLSLILLDLDHFKKVNDTHGHAAGDAVLRSAAEALRSVCRDVDLPARIGGEELAILLPETDRRGARRVADRVREKIEATRHRSPEGDEFHVTASAGVGSVGAGAQTGDALLRTTDDALYRAKRTGRNRVVVSG